MFIGMLLSPAAMILSSTILAESMRSCSPSRLEAAKAVHVSMKQRLIDAIVFFIIKVLSSPPAFPARMVEF
jgi:hypothetical protein